LRAQAEPCRELAADLVRRQVAVIYRWVRLAPIAALTIDPPEVMGHKRL